MKFGSGLCFLFCLYFSSGLGAQDTIVLADNTRLINELLPAPVHGWVDYLKYRNANGAGTVRLHIGDVASATYAKSGRQYLPVTIEASPDSEGNRAKVVRFGQVFVDGPQRLVKVALASRDYDATIRGSKTYAYLLTTEEETYQLDVMNTTGTGRVPTASGRYRNVLAYLFSDCGRAERMSRNADFTDRDFVNVLAAAADCAGNDGQQLLDAYRSQHVSGTFHHLQVGYQLLMNNGSGSRGPSAGLSYTVKSYLSIMPGFSMQLGLGVHRVAFASHFYSGPAHVMARGRVLLNVDVYRSGSKVVDVGAGYTIYNSVRGSDRARDRLNGSYGMISFQSTYQFGKHFAAVACYQPGFNRIFYRPGNILEFGLRYRFVRN